MPAGTALFIDGENISATLVGQITNLCGQPGSAMAARVYGDVARLDAWARVPGFRLVHSGQGKNATDLLLAVEAMEFSFAQPGAAFVIVTSDADFSHLAHRLRERGHAVTGMGEAKTSPAFRASCQAFHEICVPKKALPPAVQEAPVASPPARDRLDLAIRSTIAANSTGKRGMPVVQLATEMKQRHGIMIGTLPERRWRPYLQARPALYALEPKGPDAHVRFLPEGFRSLLA
ncbi:NYN domain-containing protein [Gemmobacter sp.]|uniref:NYN domain-containing protein n=1 Tax=Gemmobacter sp. TaxID=1898957 RepID=UPI002AFE1277|nr:NYN domain-containing protein [Gemmobacter sp.]